MAFGGLGMIWISNANFRIGQKAFGVVHMDNLNDELFMTNLRDVLVNDKLEERDSCLLTRVEKQRSPFQSGGKTFHNWNPLIKCNQSITKCLTSCYYFSKLRKLI